MTAAHELASWPGFEVVVFEFRAVAGGKARSMDAIPGVGGRRALPGEHGFRFFPGFYKHVPDTMSRIPYSWCVWLTFAVIEVAEESGAGLIAIGAHGNTAGRRFTLGSVASKLSHHAPSSLLIVREN